jgi:hypothetical protein
MTRGENSAFSAHRCVFYFQFTESERGRAYSQRDCFTRDTLRAVLQWLISDCRLFGLPVQNWMWVLPSGLLLYLAVLTIIRRRQTSIR